MATLRMVVFVLWAPVVLFLSSGRLDWIMGWVFSGLYVGSFFVAVAIIARTNPDLIVERATHHENMKSWDKALMPIVAFAAPALIWITAGLGKRFDWPSAFSFETQIATAMIMIISVVLSTWAMASNRFFSSVVRIQHDVGMS